MDIFSVFSVEVAGLVGGVIIPPLFIARFNRDSGCNVLKQIIIVLFALVFAFAPVEPAFAYVGPGAGFAFLGSASIFIVTLLMLVATILFWPIQWMLLH